MAAVDTSNIKAQLGEHTLKAVLDRANQEDNLKAAQDVVADFGPAKAK